MPHPRGMNPKSKCLQIPPSFPTLPLLHHQIHFRSRSVPHRVFRFQRHCHRRRQYCRLRLRLPHPYHFKVILQLGSVQRGSQLLPPLPIPHSLGHGSMGQISCISPVRETWTCCSPSQQPLLFGRWWNHNVFPTNICCGFVQKSLRWHTRLLEKESRLSLWESTRRPIRCG